jgi:hypothetical protein
VTVEAFPIVPDGITPEVGWRGWSVLGGTLSSVNQHNEWPTREAFVATCAKPPPVRWVPHRYGAIVPRGRIAQEHAHQGLVIGGYAYGYETSGRSLDATKPPPMTQLPEGWGYELEAVDKEVPDEYCTCGIYALKSRAAIVCSPYAREADAVGAVSLWGKIVPGEDGYRAQYAYPLLIFTDYDLDDYGVQVLPRREMGRDMPVRLLRGK